MNHSEDDPPFPKIAWRITIIDVAQNEGVTPLQHARQRGYHEIEQVLLQAGAH